MTRRKLRIDDLSVESFETVTQEMPRGTVGANQTGPLDPVSCGCVTDEFQSCPQTCGMYSCAGNTCGATCQSCAGCGSGSPFTCAPEQSCNPDDTCACTAYTLPCQ